MIQSEINNLIDEPASIRKIALMACVFPPHLQEKGLIKSGPWNSQSTGN
jgi:hypothetical protein